MRGTLEVRGTLEEVGFRAAGRRMRFGLLRDQAVMHPAPAAGRYGPACGRSALTP
ncbi:hypothetical protein [uncultured Thiodictyon sp.]|uniref:hypothetical protein n=1 Tax=uncultured Thiodictyon sp. TaxID=1846217 RepID=UPI002600292B|nr:hypothetical protein [uncultured Thiodictyon sp.]